jgi:D-alanine-D-alanine ligase
MTGRVRVGLIFGGSSVEHEVSVVSARGIARALDPARVESVPIGVTGEGTWLSPEASGRILEGKADRVEASADDGVRIVAEPGGGLRTRDREGAGESLPLDAVFCVMHGWGGEDGRIQGLLDLAGLPYVGPGVLGSAVGMDKAVAKAVFERCGLPVAPWTSFVRSDYESDPEAVMSAVESRLSFPVFVKPSNGGSSVGISKVASRADFAGAIDRALLCDRKVVVEEGLDAREIECAVLGNDRPEASVAGEIVPSREFYDYEAKYLDGTSRLLIPAPLDAAAEGEIRRLAVEAFRALDLAGMARVDFFLARGTGRIYLNEVNTLPGFTPISMYPKLWEASGLAYRDLLFRLIQLAMDRATSERRRASRRTAPELEGRVEGAG